MSGRGRVVALIVASVALAAASSARAAVTISQDEVVVAGSGARAVIDRDPFRLRVEQADGTPALSEVQNTTPAPTPLAPTMDPAPPGADVQSSAQIYAPLTFLVGQEAVNQYNGLVWGGNLLSAVRSGVQYSARSVVDAAPIGDGVRLTISTDDPSGRSLIAEIAPGPGVIRVSVSAQPAEGVATIGDSFQSDSGEGFYGFGGRHDGLDQHGRAFSSWVDEENVTGPLGDTAAQTLESFGAGPAILFPNGPAAAYYPQAQFISSRGYGFLLDQSDLARFRLDTDLPDAWSVTASAPSLRYVVAPGQPSQAVGALTALGGRQPPPPDWALGPMFDRLVLNFGESESHYESGLNADIANIDHYHLPLTAFRVEGWGFPNDPSNDGLALHSYTSAAEQQRIVGELRARGIHPLFYLRPWITPGSAPDLAGLTVRQANGQTYVTTGTSGQQIALLDFTNPAAVAYWQKEVAKVFDLGADGFMQDFGEEVLNDMHFADGETGATMHNRYLILYTRATREEIDRYEQAHPGRQLWFFNRAGYSGTPGSAAYEGANFPGDETTDWSHASGLASSTSDMLNRAVGGAYGFATDIGGYADYSTPATTKELFLRWAEWAALSPVFRLHGSGVRGTHTPWSFDQETVDIYKQLSLLHERASPLIAQLWRNAQSTGIPPTRPLWLQFPADPNAAAQDQEWMLGPDVLVAPVVSQGATSRSVYFPAGCWRAPQTGMIVVGAANADVAAPLGFLPYFFRCGSDPFAAASSGRAGCARPRQEVVHIRLARGAHVRSVLVTSGRTRLHARVRRHGTEITVTFAVRGSGSARIRVRLAGGRTLRVARRYRGC